jgi:hypothetical protein
MVILRGVMGGTELVSIGFVIVGDFGNASSLNGDGVTIGGGDGEASRSAKASALAAALAAAALDLAEALPPPRFLPGAIFQTSRRFSLNFSFCISLSCSLLTRQVEGYALFAYT